MFDDQKILEDNDKRFDLEKELDHRFHQRLNLDDDEFDLKIKLNFN